MVNSKLNFRNKVFEAVQAIPKGKVATYGQIALMLGKARGAREVGWMLHSNDSSAVPCHRVVNRKGRLAPNFGGPSLKSFGRLAPSKFQRSGAFSAKGGPAFGWDGAREQKRRLEVEGVGFVDDMHVDIEKYLADSLVD